jgi:general transcription factor 3C polypeptide 3 (transcription factor C subunit 4)
MVFFKKITDLGAEVADKTRVPNIEVPENYRGISFSSWLDIFLDFALCLARQGRMAESYEICEAAKDCALFYHSREELFLIYVCWTSKGKLLI